MDTLATQHSDIATRRRHDQLRSFQIDYKEGIEAIYTRFIKFLIASDGNLNCLEVLGSRRSVPNLPSWSTDWRPSAYCYCCSQDAFQIPRYFIDSLPAQYPPGKPKRANRISSGQPMLEQTVANELHLLGYQLGVAQQDYRFFKPDRYAWRTDTEYNMLFSHRQKIPNHDGNRRGPLDKLIQTDRMKAVAIDSAAGTEWRSRLQKLTRTERVCGVLVDSEVRGGDVVVQLLGSRMVHVLRPSQPPRTYSLVTAGLYCFREGGVAGIAERLPVFKDDDFEPADDMTLYGDIYNFADRLTLRTKDERDFGRCAAFRNRVFEVVGMSKDNPDREVSQPELALFKLV